MSFTARLIEAGTDTSISIVGTYAKVLIAKMEAQNAYAPKEER